MQSLRVSDYMNCRPVTFSIEMSVAEAVERLLQSGQTGGPVVADHNKDVGLNLAITESKCVE